MCTHVPYGTRWWPLVRKMSGVWESEACAHEPAFFSRMRPRHREERSNVLRVDLLMNRLTRRQDTARAAEAAAVRQLPGVLRYAPVLCFSWPDAGSASCAARMQALQCAGRCDFRIIRFQMANHKSRMLICMALQRGVESSAVSAAASAFASRDRLHRTSLSSSRGLACDVHRREGSRNDRRVHHLRVQIAYKSESTARSFRITPFSRCLHSPNYLSVFSRLQTGVAAPQIRIGGEVFAQVQYTRLQQFVSPTAARALCLSATR